MQIRRLESADKSSLKRLIREVYNEPEARTALLFTEKPNSKLLDEVIKRKTDAGQSGLHVDIVAHESGMIIADCEVIREEGDHSAAKVGIVVKRGYRKNGLGRRMLYKALEDAQQMGIKTFIAEVAASNMTARKFFVDAGFKKVDMVLNGARFEDEYVDVIIFRKTSGI